MRNTRQGKTRVQCDDNVMLVIGNKGENKTQRDSANQHTFVLLLLSYLYVIILIVNYC